jgi:hypothetical protein
MHIPGFRRRVLAGGETYVERRPDESLESYEQREAEAREAAYRPIPADERHAYEEGRRDQHRAEVQADRRVERPRRRGGFGLVGLLVVLVAALGVVWITLAAREGSFAQGGAVVDEKLAEVTQPARVAATEAVDRTGQAVQNAGQALENQGERIRENAR